MDIERDLDRELAIEATASWAIDIKWSRLLYYYEDRIKTDEERERFKAYIRERITKRDTKYPGGMCCVAGMLRIPDCAEAVRAIVAETLKSKKQERTSQYKFALMGLIHYNMDWFKGMIPDVVAHLCECEDESGYAVFHGYVLAEVKDTYGSEVYRDCISYTLKLADRLCLKLAKYMRRYGLD